MLEPATDAFASSERKLLEKYGLQAKEHVVEVTEPGTNVRVLEAGEGPAILFLHGAPNAAASWVPLVAQLSGFRSLMVDSPGAGLSTRVKKWRNVRDESAAIVGAIVDQLQVENTALVASSLGGLYGYGFAIARPERVSSLVLAGCPSGPNMLPFPITERISTLPLPGFVARMFIKGTMEGAKKAHAEIGHGPSVENGTIPMEMLEWWAELISSTGTLQNMLRDVRGFDTFFGRKRTGRFESDELAALSVPLLYLWGDADPMAKPEDGDRLAALTPGARIEHFTGFGHLPWLDDPQRIGRSLRMFLSGE